MSDFTDDEDRQLVQLALVFSRHRRQILWDKLAQQMKSAKKSKETLQQRLKTLKRTHGRDLENFPAWFFKKKFAKKPKLCHPSADPETAIHEEDKTMLRGRHYKPQGKVEVEVKLQLNGSLSVKTRTKLEESLSLQMSPCFPKCWKTKPYADAPTSLKLLADVATRNLQVPAQRRRVNG